MAVGIRVESLLAIGVIVDLVWFWSGSLRARAFALRECKTACERTDMQLLDQTVALASVGLTHDDEGRVHIRLPGICTIWPPMPSSHVLLFAAIGPPVLGAAGWGLPAGIVAGLAVTEVC